VLSCFADRGRAAAILVLVLPTSALAQLPAPQSPALGPVRVIGSQGAGCIAGAVRLPDTAPGLQTIRLSRSSFWGHPDTVAALELLGRRAYAAGLPDLYIGDISGPRGGPLRDIHFSHQMGIDADVWLDVTSPRPALPPSERETIEPPSLVRPDGRGVDPARWSDAEITLLRLAAELPRIDRILVNPAIKQQLCEDVTSDRSWLRLIRPWWGHAAHMHIRWRCPDDQPECVQAPPPPPGDGCDASLQWWFDQLNAPPKPPLLRQHRRPCRRPAAPSCRAILAAPGD
jgi:penicillin-insensitive murein endopeptidase